MMHGGGVRPVDGDCAKNRQFNTVPNVHAYDGGYNNVQTSI